MSLIFGASEIIKSLVDSGGNYLKSTSYSWIIRLCLNLLSYATVLVPGYLIYKYVRLTKYIQRGGK